MHTILLTVNDAILGKWFAKHFAEVCSSPPPSRRRMVKIMLNTLHCIAAHTHIQLILIPENFISVYLQKMEQNVALRKRHIFMDFLSDIKNTFYINEIKNGKPC